MYEAIKYRDIRAYDGMGLVSVKGRLMVPARREALQESLDAYRHDWFWMRTYVNRQGSIALALEATLNDGLLYRTVDMRIGEMLDGSMHLRAIQRGVKAAVMKRRLTVLSTLKRWIPLELILKCMDGT